MRLSLHSVKKFQKEVYDYCHAHGRHDLPWRKTKDPYKVLVSEVMLQQTQVARVASKYGVFVKKFPTFKKLAQASFRDVATLWSGLGYNRRALALFRLAKIVVEKHKGELPVNVSELDLLPGIGHATASAICTFAYNKPLVFVETNIRSVFIHQLRITNQCECTNIKDKEILKLVEQTLDRENPREWYWALMDYGAMIKKKYGNPNAWSAHYTKQTPFRGSDRYFRGEILKRIVKNKNISATHAEKQFGIGTTRMEKIFTALSKDGFIKKQHEKYVLVEK